MIEIAFASNDFSFNLVAAALLDRDADLLQAGGDVVEPGRLAAALGLGALDRLHAALFATRNKLRELVPYATAVMMGVATFFIGLMLFASGVNPFATVSTRCRPTASASTRCSSTRA